MENLASVRMRVKAVSAFSLLLLLNSVRASEYKGSDNIAPESVEEAGSPITDLIEEKAPTAAVEKAGRALFIDDSKLGLKFRTYVFDRNNNDGSETYAWAAGGELAYRTGRWKDILIFEASLFTSQPIDAPENKDGSKLLAPGQNAINVVGKANLELNWDSWRARVYRQDFNIPYLNRDDSRMVANTFEAYALMHKVKRFALLAAYVDKIKPRDANSFTAMSKAAGATGEGTGVAVLGGRYTFANHLTAGGLTLYNKDVFNTAYAEMNWTRKLTPLTSLQGGIQYSDQRSVGDERLGSFSTHTWGAKTALSFRNAILTLAYTNTDSGAAIRSPFGGRPSYNSLMLGDFDFAGEESLRVGLSYNLKRVGLEGLSAFYNYAEGRNGIDETTGAKLPDRFEHDFTLDYRPSTGKLKGFWLRLRYAVLESEGSDKVENFRFTINYDVNLHD